MALLDISPAALDHAKARLGPNSEQVEWIVADVTTFAPMRTFALWHDRAVFHLLTQAEDRSKYLEALRRAVPAGGHVIIATFASAGPSKCSGLPVVRYDEASIAAELGPAFILRDSRCEIHTTPWHTEQRFVYFWFQYLPG